MGLDIDDDGGRDSSKNCRGGVDRNKLHFPIIVRRKLAERVSVYTYSISGLVALDCGYIPSRPGRILNWGELPHRTSPTTHKPSL